MKTFDEHFEESCHLRDSYWELFGKKDSHVLTHLVNQAFMGGPRWPAMRQAFIKIEGENSTILASDGLSDPFDDVLPVDMNGFELEFYSETTERFQQIEECKGAWQYQMVYQMSQFAAQHGDIISLLRELEYLSTELYDVPVPSDFLTENDRVGVLLGLPHAHLPASVPLSAGEARIVNIKLLTVSELNYCIANGKEGRRKLADAFVKEGAATVSSLERRSMF